LAGVGSILSLQIVTCERLLHSVFKFNYLMCSLIMLTIKEHFFIVIRLDLSTRTKKAERTGVKRFGKS